MDGNQEEENDKNKKKTDKKKGKLKAKLSDSTMQSSQSGKVKSPAVKLNGSSKVSCQSAPKASKLAVPDTKKATGRDLAGGSGASDMFREEEGEDRFPGDAELEMGGPTSKKNQSDGGKKQSGKEEHHYGKRINLGRGSYTQEDDEDSIPRRKLEGVIKIYKEVVVEMDGVKTVVIDKYLEAYAELLELMQILGKLLGIVTRDLEQKVACLRRLKKKNAKPYEYLHLALKHELNSGIIDNKAEEKEKGPASKSATRNMLRLHYAMEFMLHFFGQLETNRNGRLSDIVSESYKATLYRYHNWFVRQAASVCFLALPNRRYLTGKLGYAKEDQLLVVIKELSTLGHEIYTTVDNTFTGSLDLSSFN